jgi:hypothetical protein
MRLNTSEHFDIILTEKLHMFGGVYGDYTGKEDEEQKGIQQIRLTSYLQYSHH